MATITIINIIVTGILKIDQFLWRMLLKLICVSELIDWS